VVEDAAGVGGLCVFWLSVPPPPPPPRRGGGGG